jgi:pseudolysin
MRYRLFLLSAISSACLSSAFAAQPIDLSHQSNAALNSFSMSGSALKEVSQHVDFNQTKHVRLQQTYLGYPVLGGDAISHTNQGKQSMNGILYQGLQADLGATPGLAANAAQANRATQFAIETYQKKAGVKLAATDVKTDLVVYIDKANKAHWAYFIHFLMKPASGMPAKPSYIIDATHLTVYQEWNNIQTMDDTMGGGYGGNEKMGKLVYDGLQGDLPELPIERDMAANLCYLENANVTVKDVRHNDAVAQFECGSTDSQHNNEYWDADYDAVNGGYSPSNDALFVGDVIKQMYQDWYHLPVLTQNGKPMMLVMRVHENMDNAYWDGQAMTFGDGISMFYPLVSFGVGAHEISHGFTEQHSGLAYYSQSGGLNESFSDMAAVASEYYAYGHNGWQVAPEVFKAKDQALRYMDKPSKDCHGKTPGNWCSIDTVSQYYEGLDVHFSSGIFNRFFYTLGTAKGWDTHKAFDVMVKANMDYWTPNTTFQEAACGVLKATQDYKYDPKAVELAATTVGLVPDACY